MKYVLIVLLLLAMLLAMTPFIMMFINNISKIKGNLSFEAERRTKLSLKILPLISLILIVITIILAII